jgi:hypothetical protein
VALAIGLHQVDASQTNRHASGRFRGVLGGARWRGKGVQAVLRQSNACARAILISNHNLFIVINFRPLHAPPPAYSAQNRTNFGYVGLEAELDR